jgi:hypothetical protein
MDKIDIFSKKMDKSKNKKERRWKIMNIFSNKIGKMEMGSKKSNK